MKKTRLFAAASVVAILFGTSSAAQDMAFSLTNNSDATLVELKVGESSNENWDEDILDGESIDPGETADISVEDDLEDCEYDVQALYDDGDTEEVFNVDLCRLSNLTVEDDDFDQEEEEEEEEEEEQEQEQEEDDEDDEEYEDGEDDEEYEDDEDDEEYEDGEDDEEYEDDEDDEEYEDDDE
jgi:protein MAK16